jgi:hypothetical protein
MSVSWVPDDIKDLVIVHPANKELELTLVVRVVRLLDQRVKVLHALNTAIKELRLETLAAELNLKDFSLLAGLSRG